MLYNIYTENVRYDLIFEVYLLNVGIKRRRQALSIKVLTIVNPTSGKGNVDQNIDEIEKNIKEQGMETEIVLTKKEKDAKEIIMESAANKDLILVCGGDGTLNEVVTAMIEKNLTDISLSFVPMGTTNDLAKTLDMPTKDISITKKLLETKAKRIDIGKWDKNKYFCYVAAFGVITDVSYSTSQEAKHRYGRLAYYINAIKELVKIPSYRMKLRYDDKHIEDEFIYGGITNSESIAGFKWFAKGEIQLDDGLFEGIFIRKPRTIFGYLKILNSFFKKDYHENEYILFAQAKNFEIEAEEDIKWTIDGEFAGNQKNVKIENMQKAIELAICEKEDKKA